MPEVCEPGRAQPAHAGPLHRQAELAPEVQRKGAACRLAPDGSEDLLRGEGWDTEGCGWQPSTISLNMFGSQ